MNSKTMRGERRVNMGIFKNGATRLAQDKQNRKTWSVVRKLQEKLLLRAIDKGRKTGKPLEYEDIRVTTNGVDFTEYLCLENRWVLDLAPHYKLVGRMGEDGIVEFY